MLRKVFLKMLKSLKCFE